MACEAFENYMLHAMSLSATDIEALRDFFSTNMAGHWSSSSQVKQNTEDLISKHFSNKREAKEFLEKLESLLDNLSPGT
jgi:hypothetical protein